MLVLQYKSDTWLVFENLGGLRAGTFPVET